LLLHEERKGGEEEADRQKSKKENYLHGKQKKKIEQSKRSKRRI
jgi:hypothetical protein